MDSMVRPALGAMAFAGTLLVACGGASVPSLPAASPAFALAMDSRAEPSSDGLRVADEILRLCGLEGPELQTMPTYEFDRSELSPSDRKVLSLVAECLSTGALKKRSIRLVGRADPRGEATYNMALGAERAGGVARYMGWLGIATSRVSVTSRGELDARGIDEAGWRADRRVDILLEP
jgi:peptidoglycan-associated lipoprotein